MEEIKIRLTTAEEVREFVRAARKCEFDVDISYGRAVVDGKSIMGIFALGLEPGISTENTEICAGSIMWAKFGYIF